MFLPSGLSSISSAGRCTRPAAGRVFMTWNGTSLKVAMSKKNRVDHWNFCPIQGGMMQAVPCRYFLCFSAVVARGHHQGGGGCGEQQVHLVYLDEPFHRRGRLGRLALVIHDHQPHRQLPVVELDRNATGSIGIRYGLLVGPLHLRPLGGLRTGERQAGSDDNFLFLRRSAAAQGQQQTDRQT